MIRTLGEIVRDALEDPDLGFQILHEVLTKITVVRGKGSAVTFLTQELTPSEVLHPGQMEKIGILIRVPRTVYEKEG